MEPVRPGGPAPRGSKKAKNRDFTLKQFFRLPSPGGQGSRQTRTPTHGARGGGSLRVDPRHLGVFRFTMMAPRRRGGAPCPSPSISSMPKSPPLLPLLLALLLQSDRGPAWSSWIEKDLPMRRVTRFLSWSHQPLLWSVQGSSAISNFACPDCLPQAGACQNTAVDWLPRRRL